jgi:hypothetical protein
VSLGEKFNYRAKHERTSAFLNGSIYVFRGLVIKRSEDSEEIVIARSRFLCEALGIKCIIWIIGCIG